MNRVEFICPICRETILGPASLAGEASPCPRCGLEVSSWPLPEKTPPTPTDTASAIWHYVADDQQRGPVTEAQLREMIDEGTIRRRDLVWREGMPEWVQVGTLPEFYPQPKTKTVARRTRSFNEDDDDRPRRTPHRRRKPRPDSRVSYTIPIVIAGFAILALVGVFALAAFSLWAKSNRPMPEGTDSEYGKRLEFKGGELYYTTAVTTAEAHRLGEYLIREGFFDGKDKTVQLTRSGNIYQVRWVVNVGADRKPEYIKTCQQFSRDLSADVFYGASTEVHLCDEHLKTLRVVSPYR